MTANGWFLLFWPQASQIWPLPNAPRSETVLIRFVSQNKFLIAEADAVLQGAGRERSNSTIPVPARSPPHRQPVARADLDGVCAQRHPSIQRCGRAIARGNSRKASPSRRPCLAPPRKRAPPKRSQALRGCTPASVGRAPGEVLSWATSQLLPYRTYAQLPQHSGQHVTRVFNRRCGLTLWLHLEGRWAVQLSAVLRCAPVHLPVR